MNLEQRRQVETLIGELQHNDAAVRMVARQKLEALYQKMDVWLCLSHSLPGVPTASRPMCSQQCSSSTLCAQNQSSEPGYAQCVIADTRA